MGRDGTVAILVAENEPLAFATVAAALDHAALLQPGRRIGVDAGPEPEARTRAARLSRDAETGQVLVTDRARWAARDGHAFRDAGTPSGAAPAWELLWAEPPPRTRIRLCGPLRIEIDGAVPPAPPAGQAAALLGFLLARPDRAADRAELIDALWPARAPRDPQTALRPLLTRARRMIAPGTLEGRGRVRAALPEPVWTDLEEAAQALAAARAAARAERWTEVRGHAGAALELLRPGFLSGLDDDWVHERRTELEELELEALEWVARAALGTGGPELGAAERASRALVARSPFRETGHRFLMEALAAGGNAAEALRVYDDLRVLLREELGTAPAAEVQALHQRLLAGDAPARTPPEPEAPVPLPPRLAPQERSAFVARGRELEVLRAAWREAMAGRGRLVFVGGEPGIGKTRLTTEFASEARRAGVVLSAACHEEALVSYQPFVEMLRAAGLREAEVAALPGAAELARIVPGLPAPPAAEPGDAELRRYLLFESVTAALALLAVRAPLALVIDDLHWADRGTLHLLRHVARAAHGLPLLLLGTYRDAEVRPAHALAEVLADLRRDHATDRLTLDGLAERDVGALIAAHTGTAAPPALVSTLHEHTDGNPFFVEEVLRHLLETGVVFERGGRLTSALTADEIGVPEGVQEVLGRRLARLSDPCRAILVTAAVLGREWSFETLRATLDADEDELIALLEEARDAQLIVELDRAEPAFAFTHALVRQTLYTGTSAPRRRRLHAQAAAALEQAGGAAPVAALALHHRLAGAAGDPERAVRYSVEAGAQAAAQFGWEAAAEHWDGAVAVMARAGGREREQARLLVAIADLMVMVDDLDRQLDRLERAHALYDALADGERLAQVDSRIGMAHALMDSIYAEHLDIGAAFRHFDAARPVLAQGPPRRARGHLEVGVATALTYGLRIEPGLAAASEGMAIAEAVGDEVLWAGAAEAYGWHALVAGRLGEGFAMLERAFAAADRHRRPFLAFMAANIGGQFTWGIGAPDDAQAHFERPLRLPYVGTAAYRRQIADGIGRCHASRGAFEAAREQLPEATPTWITHSLKPVLYLWDGDLDAVEALAAATLATSRRTGNRWDEWASHHLAARVLALRGEHAAAAERLAAAVAILVDGGAPYFELWVRPDLARTLAALGRAEAARAEVERCRAITASGEDWRGRAGLVDLADAVVLAAEERPDAAGTRFAAAREVLARHGLYAEETELLYEWGRLLDVRERLDEATERYRARGAGRLWLTRDKSA